MDELAAEGAGTLAGGTAGSPGWDLESAARERTPAPAELAERAEAAVRDFPSCFWFRHPEAKVGYLDDVRLVIRHLREYGGWQAWRVAQDLQRCL